MSVGTYERVPTNHSHLTSSPPRTPEYLAHTIAAARAENYALGMQLVGGAYHPYELNTHRAASASRASAPPHAP